MDVLEPTPEREFNLQKEAIELYTELIVSVVKVRDIAADLVQSEVISGRIYLSKAHRVRNFVRSYISLYILYVKQYNTHTYTISLTLLINGLCHRQ